MANFVGLEKRICSVFLGLPSDFEEYVVCATACRDKAIALGPLHDRFELNVHSYVKAMQLVRNHYFREIERQSRISFNEAVDLFFDGGYEIGFNEHWKNGLKKDCVFYNSILYAPTIEIAHLFIGDYDAYGIDGSKISHRKTPTQSQSQRAA